MKLRYVLIVVIIIYLGAIAVRLIPLSSSPRPYNNDSLLESRMAQDIVNSGGLEYPEGAEYADDRHSTITPLYNIFLAMSSLLTGLETIKISPIVVPLIVTVVVIFIFTVVLKMTGNKYAAIGSAAFVGFSGTFVTVTLAPWKEAIGLFAIPVTLYLYCNRTESRGIYGLAIFLLLCLPLLHHLVTVVTYLMVTFVTMMPLTVRALERKTVNSDKYDLIVILALWASAFLYYNITDFNRMEMFKPDSGVWLFISVFAIMLIVGMYAARPTPTRKNILYTLSAVAVGIFIVNYFTPIFPYTITTNKELLFFLLPYSLLMIPTVIGFSVIMDSNTKYRDLIIALFLAPLTIIVFAFLWGLNPTTSYPMIIRTFDFLDFGIAISSGVGFAFLLKKIRWETVKTVFSVLFLATILTTTPIAYNTESLFEIQNTTHEYEVSAMGWIKHKNVANKEISTNRRMWEVGHNLYDIKGDFVLPYYLEKQTLPSDKICIIEERWVREPGAQMWPLDSVVVSNTTFENVMTSNNLIGNIGPSGNSIYIMVKPND